MAGTASSRSASSSTMTAFLPPISQITFFNCGWPGPRASRRLPDVEADLARSGKGDHRHVGMFDERAPTSARNREDSRSPRRHAGFAQNGRKATAGTADCPDGFMMTGFPAARAAVVIPQRMASGKFHGAITAVTPAAMYSCRMSSPGNVESSTRQPAHFARHSTGKNRSLRRRLRRPRPRSFLFQGLPRAANLNLRRLSESPARSRI